MAANMERVSAKGKRQRVQKGNENVRDFPIGAMLPGAIDGVRFSFVNDVQKSS
jgi:hypothetical protein